MMTAGDTMQGRRLPDLTWGAGTDAWDSARQPGDYARIVKDGEPYAWYVMTPNGHQGTLRNHTVIEHDDGTVTASPSIVVSLVGTDEGWHGYLEGGVWREV